MSTYLKRATQTHVPKWYNIVQAERQRLQLWMPHIAGIHDLLEAQTYIQQHSGTGFHMSKHIYEIWEEENITGLLSLHSGSIRYQSAEISYWLGSIYTGKGIATNAVRLLCTKVFTNYPKIQRLYIKCQHHNLPSQAVALRLGFKTIDQKGGIITHHMTRKKWYASQYDEDHLLHFLGEIK